MAEQFLTGTIAAPGFFGLDTQDSSTQLNNGFALKAENCVIDKYGRIGCRKGWTPVNAAAEDTSPFKAIFEVVKEDGNTIISAANNNLYTGDNTLTHNVVTNATNTGTVSYTITSDNWQIVGLPYNTGQAASTHAYLVQKGHPILVYHKLGSTAHAHTGAYGFQQLGDIGTLPVGYTTATFTPNCALSAYGRLWVADIAGDRQTVYFSDTLNPSNFTTGTSGYLNLGAVVPDGDPIVALAAHNGFLFIMCQKHVVIYNSPQIPANMVLQDVVSGIGCIARDSVQVVAGKDIFFLSETGIQSLQRVVQEKSMPFRDVSKNVRDELLTAAFSEDSHEIKAVYYSRDAFYAISFPTTNVTYCFDTRTQLQDGAARVTTWNGLAPTALFETIEKDLYLGRTSYIGKYSGYTDNGAVYRMSYYTNYFDFDQPTTSKILKKINLVAIGGSHQPIAIKYGFDYTYNPLSQTVTLSGSSVYEYGIAQYNIDSYATGIALENIKANLGGAGKVLQLGFESDINGNPLSIQKIDFALKAGRTMM